MISALQDHANKANAEVNRIVSGYRFSSAGLAANPALLAHVNNSFKPRESEITGEFDTEHYLLLIREGKPRHIAARILGNDPKDVKKRIKFDGAFRESVELAEEEAAEVIEEKLWNMAGLGERWAMELWLKKRHKARWGDDPTIVKHEGSIINEISAATLVDQIMALQGLLTQRVELTSGTSNDVIDADFEEQI